MAERDARVVDFLYELGLLKRHKRTGWVIAGIAEPESIADHSHRTAVIASAIAAMEGADPQRAAFLALFHDSQETRTTDIPHLGKRYLKATANTEVTREQVVGLPDALAGVITDAVDEYEARESPEAVCARDADKLECLLQAIEYREQGSRQTQPWVDTSLASLTTDTAKQLAREALARGPLEWVHRTREQKPEL